VDLGLIELLFFFGAVLAWAVWELWSVRRPRQKKGPSVDGGGDDRASRP
jgi:hypothetical protein